MPQFFSNPKHRLILILSVLLICSFWATGLISFFVSRTSLRQEIIATALPLASDNIYTEIQRDILRPAFISSMMAHNTFLKDWLLEGEQQPELIEKYLKEIMVEYGTFTSFLVSEKTRVYYHANGILKKVHPDEPRDIWFFRVRDMIPDSEINLDPDLANRDEMTIFINHKVLGYHGEFIGATGVGLTTHAVVDLIQRYRQKYDSEIIFTDRFGAVVLQSPTSGFEGDNIHKMSGLSTAAQAIFSHDEYGFHFQRDRHRVYAQSRYIPELDWYMIALKNEAGSVKNIYDSLIATLVICTLITLFILLITTWTINAFEAKNRSQQAEIQSLHGILPICSSCKKIRDDKGYWNQIETYIKQRSEAHFSHGLCPDCMRQTYPDLYSAIDRISGLLGAGRHATLEELARVANQEAGSLQRLLNLMLENKTITTVDVRGVRHYRLPDERKEDSERHDPDQRP